MPLWLMFALFVLVVYGEPPEGQRPGSGAVSCHLPKPPVAEGRIGNQVWPLAEGAGEHHPAVTDIAARQEQRSRGKAPPMRSTGSGCIAQPQAGLLRPAEPASESLIIFHAWASSYLSLGTLVTTINLTRHLSFSEKLCEN